MKIPKQFGIGVMLVVVSIVAGFLAGRENGYNNGLANWQSLPTETNTFSVNGIVGTDEQSTQKLKYLISDIEKNVIPEFCANDPNFSIAALPMDSGTLPGIVVQGNVVVQELIGRHLHHKEMVTLFEAANGELNETAVLRYTWARDTYFEMKDMVGE